MNGLHCRTVSNACPYDVVGVSFPGVPGVVLGHNARVAWGATNIDPDVQDLFVEKVDPANPDNYLFQGESVPFTVREETIKVAGGARRRHRGPRDPPRRRSSTTSTSVSRTRRRWRSPGRGRRRSTARSRRSSGSTRSGRSRSSGPRSRRTARPPRTSSTPTSMGTSATCSRATSRSAPIRPIAALASGRAATASTNGRAASRSRTCRGSSIRRAASSSRANNAAVDAEYPYFVASEWDPGYRAKRILELLEEAAGGGVTPDEMRTIQMDTRVLRADLVMPHFEGISPATPDGRAVLEQHRDVGRPGDRRERWGGGLPRDRVPPAARPLRRRAGPARPRVRRRRRLVAGDDRPARRPDVGLVGRRHDRRAEGDGARRDHGRPRCRRARTSERPRRPDELDVGTAPPGDVPRTDARDERHRAARVVLQQGRRTRSPGPPARSTTTTTARAGPTRTRMIPDYEPVGFVGVFEVTNLPSYRLDDRHGRPGRRPDRPDDRPERQPVRRPLRRSHRRVGCPAGPSRCPSRGAGASRPRRPKRLELVP